MKYWLMKNEVSDYSIQELKKDKRTDWTGVRNYQARNFMRDEMSPGDLAIFYHSNADPSGAAGIMEISSKAKPDETQFDKKSKYYDSKATKDNPRWMLREVQFKEVLPRLVPISEMREIKVCKDMLILQKGSRLSITPLKKTEFEAVVKAAKKKESLKKAS
jgi:predicted RNA-binding protein with PUA-like domain